MSDDITVTNVPTEGIFEITVDGRRAGLVQYVEETGYRTFVHTEVDDAFSGRGLAGELVRGALDATRADGLRIGATCSYVKKYLAEHSDWDDLVDAAGDEG